MTLSITQYLYRHLHQQQCLIPLKRIQLCKESVGKHHTLNTPCQYECQDQDRYDASIYTPCNAWEMVMFWLIVMVSMKTKKLRCYKVTGTATQSRLQNYKLQKMGG